MELKDLIGDAWTPEVQTAYDAELNKAASTAVQGYKDIHDKKLKDSDKRFAEFEVNQKELNELRTEKETTDREKTFISMGGKKELFEKFDKLHGTKEEVETKDHYEEIKGNDDEFNKQFFVTESSGGVTTTTMTSKDTTQSGEEVSKRNWVSDAIK